MNNLTEEDLRRQYKKDTGEEFGQMSESKYRTVYLYSDEYVRWLEEKYLEKLNSIK
jgi:hypothetical protein